MTKFKTGKTYYCWSPCDYDCIWNFEILSRTAKTISIKIYGETKTKRIGIYDGVEEIKPLGSYSMAPILRADKIKE